MRCTELREEAFDNVMWVYTYALVDLFGEGEFHSYEVCDMRMCFVNWTDGRLKYEFLRIVGSDKEVVSFVLRMYENGRVIFEEEYRLQK